MTRRNANAFTLIELLVVVAIIALLISILLPSLTAARDVARMVKCQSILKQIESAHQMYVNENDGWFVPVRINQPGSAIRWYQWLKFRAMLSLRQGNPFPDGLICPNVPEDQRAINGNVTWTWGMNNSTTGNAAMRLQAEPMAYKEGDRNANQTRTGTANGLRYLSSKIANPSSKLINIDATDWRANRANSDYVTRWDFAPHTRGPNSQWPHPAGFAQISAYRHDDGANIGMADGHVEHRPKTEVWYTNANGSNNGAQTQRLWFLYRKN